MVDRKPGIAGYQDVFLFMLVCAFIGLIAALVLQRVNRKSKIKSMKSLKTMRIAHPESDGEPMVDMINESARQTPVIAQTDVLVIGGRSGRDYPLPLRQGG